MTHLSTRMQFAGGASNDPQAAVAVLDVIAQIESCLTGQVDLLLVFASSHHAAALAMIDERLQQAFKPRVSIGTTARGVIGDRNELQHGPGLSVLAATIPDAILTPFRFAHVDWSTMASNPDDLRRVLGADETAIRAVMLLADPFSTPVMQMLRTFDTAIGDIPVVGGMASGAAEAGDNRLLLNGRLLTGGVVGLSIAGDMAIDCTVSQGCRPVGKPYVITKSKRHVVLKLGGHAAADVLAETIKGLDDEDRDLVRSQGMLVGRVINEYKSRFGRGDFVIRKIDGYDEDRGYVAIHDTAVRTGQTIQFHIRDKHTAVEDMAMLLQAQKLYGPASGAILFTDTERGLNLFDQPDTDATMVYDALGDVPLAGLFATGEIGPVGGHSFLHSHATSLVVFRPGL